MHKKICAIMLLISVISTPVAVFASSLQWPMASPHIVQGFGVTEFVKAYPDFYRYGEHLAIDLDVGFGASILSATSGVIIAKGKKQCPNYSYPDCNFGYGNWQLIWHNDLNLATVYQHLAEPTTREVGETVNGGDVIGYQGASGKIIGSHLHFAVFEGPVKIYSTSDGNVDFQIMGREKVKNPLTLLPDLETADKSE